MKGWLYLERSKLYARGVVLRTAGRETVGAFNQKSDAVRWCRRNGYQMRSTYE